MNKAPDGSSPEQAILLDTMDFEISELMFTPYRPAPQIKADIKHLELNLSFGLLEKEVYGKAKLDISAYASDIDTIQLDAKNFEIKSIFIAQKDTVYKPDFAYDGNMITLPLISKLSTKELVKVTIEYTARPTEIVTDEGSAIQSNQGLYFINTDRSIADKPLQIWSQGEPESNSTWFPSIDKPHEKFSQEIFLTVDTTFKTISNGKLMYSDLHNDGTRTDYWKQELEHSNYLVMIAVGEFEEVRDHWKNKDVFYYVDEKYAPFAMDIFGNTPEMLTFYSQKLGFEYPWDKYHQVVVKDFVSGAMENTSAVIHGDFVQLTKRELIDNSQEDVIAHELFHHWFGDIVTCETWSQITLNEGFATYGEYLWKTYKYGAEEARHHLNNDLKAYLGEAKNKPKHLIRFHYDKIDDVFDSHSYQKGGRVLHMLRLEVGDDLFFKALSNYLHQYQYKTAEIEDLRMVFEHTTGLDLKWFFDQWYQGVGHPKMESKSTFDQESNTLKIEFTQTQPENWPTFSLHIPVAIAQGDSFQIKNLWLDSRNKTFEIALNEMPSWFVVDPYSDMLWENTETKDSIFWANQLRVAPSFLARNKALIELYSTYESQRLDYLTLAMRDPFWATQALALSAITSKYYNEALSNEIQKIAKTNANSTVRAQAIIALDSLHLTDSNYVRPFIEGMADSSFLVLKYSLNALADRDACLAAELCAPLADLEEGNLTHFISKAYGQCGEDEYARYFIEKLAKASSVESFILSNDFVKFCFNNGKEKHFRELYKAVKPLALEGDSWYSRFGAIKALESALAFYDGELQELERKTEQDAAITEQIAQYRSMKAEINAVLAEAKAKNDEFMD